MRKLLLLSMLGACTQTGYQYFGSELWDSNVVSANDGVYISLPKAETLVRVQDDGTFARVDLDGARPTRMIPSPDGSSVLVFAEWDECPDEDPEIEYKVDCPEDLVVHQNT